MTLVAISLEVSIHFFSKKQALEDVNIRGMDNDIIDTNNNGVALFRSKWRCRQ